MRFAGSVMGQTAFASRAIPCLRNYVLEQQPNFSGTLTAHISAVYVIENNAFTHVYIPVWARLVLWEPYTPFENECPDFIRSRRDWDLNTEVRSDIQGSTYLLRPEEARAMVRRCLAGDKVEMRFSRGRLVWAQITVAG